MAIPVDRVKVIADAVLAAAVAGMTAGAIVPQTRRGVVDGEPAWDCSELAVHVRSLQPMQGNVSTTDTTRLRSGGLVQYTATIDVHSVRCVPAASKTVPVPLIADIDDSAEAVTSDAVAIINGLVSARSAKSLPSAETAIIGAVSVPNSGGFGGWVVTLQVGLSWAPGSGP